MCVGNAEEAIHAQQDAVAALGFYLVPLSEFLERCGTDASLADDLDALLELQRHLRDPRLLEKTTSFLARVHCDNYSSYVSAPCNDALHIITSQTIHKHKQPADEFIKALREQYDRLASVMLTIAKLRLPDLNVNIRARNPFEAYCFFRSVINEFAKRVLLADPYVDASIFHLYLYALPKDADITVVTSPSKWVERVREEFARVEMLYRQEYPKYRFAGVDDLHDRHLIVDNTAYHLGGSLKDAAKKADFRVVELPSQSVDELMKRYVKPPET